MACFLQTAFIVAFLIISIEGYADVVAAVFKQTHVGCDAVILQERTISRWIKAIKNEKDKIFGTTDLVKSFNHFSIENVVLQAPSPTMESVLTALTRQKNCYAFIISGSVAYTEQQLDAIREAAKLFESYYFVLVTEDINPNTPKRSIKGVFDIQNGVVLKINARNGVITVYDVKLGRYTLRQILSEEKYLEDRPSNLPNMGGEKLTVGVLVYPPFVSTIATFPGYDGLDIKVLTAIAKELNFTFTLKPPADGQWGSIVNGTWTGFIGQVLYGETNISMCALGITHVRYEVVDFSKEYYYDMTIFVVPVPGLVPQWQSLIRPFGFYTWIFLLVSLVFVFVAYYATSLTYVKVTEAPVPLSLPTKSFMNCLRVISNENVKVLPVDSPSRIVIGIWLTAATVILASYAGLLTSLLINPIRGAPISTPTDLASQDKVKWGKTNYNGNPEKFFRESTIPSYQKIWKEMIFVKNMRECLERTFTENFACIDEISGLALGFNKATDIYKGKSSALFATEFFFNWNVGMALPKGSALKEYFDTVIVKLQEAGIVTKWLIDMNGLPKKAQKVDEKKEVILNLNHLTGAFYLLILGLASALFTFAFNLLISVFNSHN